MIDTFQTVKDYAESQFKEKGSKFIGRIYSVQSRDEAEAQLDALRKEYYDATHHCSAFRVGIGDQAIFHYDDDGEPSGTAGKPIYQAITGAELTNVLIVVTRYYGGTKLGTGGLIRAYGGSAKMTIEAATIVKRVLKESVKIQTTYDDISIIMRLVDQLNGDIAEQEYGKDIKLTIRVRRSNIKKFRDQLIEQTAGRVHFYT